MTPPLTEDEFACLIAEHGRAIRAFIGRFAPSLADGDDIAQQTNLTLWLKRDRFDPSQSFSKWALGVAFIEVKRRRTQLGKSKLFFSTDSLDLMQSEPIVDSDSVAERNQVLQECIRNLNDTDRGLIELRYRQGLSVAETAKTSGMQSSATYKALKRIRERLREGVERAVAASELGSGSL
ncbi:RNA polymerase sigma factor [Rubripirellula tenax]|uniref:RNA polymerase sigma factor n=1 Tax=Rubripirellula tenax TaxID=2528015 RepID=A0A5C6FCN1_9BACT|nr:sigma-70 family RNA polymerase sigma factor [Rubripirellula tenax]TWU59218.1 RNA polymerase sigma factor [Rubripirellula tenax]